MISEVLVPVAHPAATDVDRAIAGVRGIRADLDGATGDIYPRIRLSESSGDLTCGIL